MAAPDTPADPSQVNDLGRVAALIRSSGSTYADAVAALLEQVAGDHADDLCGYCSPHDGVPGSCPVAGAADHVAFSWLLDERPGQ